MIFISSTQYFPEKQEVDIDKTYVNLSKIVSIQPFNFISKKQTKLNLYLKQHKSQFIDVNNRIYLSTLEPKELAKTIENPFK